MVRALGGGALGVSDLPKITLAGELGVPVCPYPVGQWAIPWAQGSCRSGAGFEGRSRAAGLVGGGTTRGGVASWVSVSVGTRVWADAKGRITQETWRQVCGGQAQRAGPGVPGRPLSDVLGVGWGIGHSGSGGTLVGAESWEEAEKVQELWSQPGPRCRGQGGQERQVAISTA